MLLIHVHVVGNQHRRRIKQMTDQRITPPAQAPGFPPEAEIRFWPVRQRRLLLMVRQSL
jgi:hypothetical protein